MKEKDLLGQLNNLRGMQADQNWVQKNREILLQQILGGEEIKEFTIFSQINLMLSRVFQPAYVAVMIVVFFVASGTFGWYGAGSAQPGDSLYVAKIAREKAQMTMTFNEQSKAKLNVEFAKNRLDELNQVIAEESTEDNGEREVKVEKLKNNIKKEIKTARERLSVPAVAVMSEDGEDGTFFTAGVGKTDQEIKIDVPDTKNITEKKPEDNIGSSNSISTKILEEAEVLVESGDFTAAASKLEEVDQAIGQDQKQKEEIKEDVEEEVVNEQK